MRSEISWFITGLVISIIFGLISGYLSSTVILYCIAYVIWLLWRINEIVQWLSSGSVSAKAPPTTGLMNLIVGLIHREKTYSRKQKNRYRAALARFNNFAAVLPDATVVLDEYNQISWCNSAAYTLLNIRTDRDIGQRINNLIRQPEFRQTLLNSEPGIETEMPSPADPNKTLSLVYVKAGKGMRVLIARDISQRVKTREMRKAFVADVSHELRTPLTVLSGYLETLIEDENMPESTHSALEHMDEQSKRMHHIVEHLLQLSKLESNPLNENEGEPVVMGKLLSNIISTVQHNTGLQHHFDSLLRDDLLLIGSEQELYSACSNLVNNAVNYTESGTQVSVAWGINQDGNPELSVRDTGQGIDSHHIPRLSERFYRVDKDRSRRTGGTGLGLAIVKYTAQRHGGELKIDSVLGKGSCFTIEFPASRIAHR